MASVQKTPDCSSLAEVVDWFSTPRRGGVPSPEYAPRPSGCGASSRERSGKPRATSNSFVSTVIVTCLAMLTWGMTSLGVQLATPLGGATAVALLAAMGNHLYQWTIASSPHRVNQVPSDQLDSDQHQVNQHQVRSRTRSAA